MANQGRLLDGVDYADIHGQFQFNFVHAAIAREDSKRFLDFAFRSDFEHNGPSVYRICQTMLQGWKRYKNYPEARVRERFQKDALKLKTSYSAALWVMEKEFRTINREVSDQIHQLRREIALEFGMASRLTANLLGPVLRFTTHREDKRLRAGKTYEPPRIVERRNWVSA
jgi:hypothetical protein